MKDIDLSGGRLVFDCAIGAGESTFHWAKRIHEQGGTSSIRGFDLSFTEEDIARIRLNLGECFRYLTLEEGDITGLESHAAESVDYINCDDTVVFLASLPDGLARAFGGFHRLLRRGGTLVVTSESGMEWGEDRHIRNQYRRWNFAKAVYGFRGGIWSVEPAMEDVRSTLERVGFRVFDQMTFGATPQEDPGACIGEWRGLMEAEIGGLRLSPGLKAALREEMLSIQADVISQGMACPPMYVLKCLKE